MSPDVVKADILEEYKLSILFANNEVRIFDMAPYLEYPIFRPLKEQNELKKIHIVDGTIEWECGAELSTDTFYLGSSQVRGSLIEM